MTAKGQSSACFQTQAPLTSLTVCAQIEFMRRTGIRIGARVYIDSDWLGEPGVSYGDGAAADRGSIVFGHLLAFNGKYNHLEHRPVDIGAGAVVGPRAALLPGVALQKGEVLGAGEMRMNLA